MGYTVISQYMYTTCNDQIRVIDVSITTCLGQIFILTSFFVFLKMS